MPVPQTRVRLKSYVRLRTTAGGLFIDPTGDIGAQLAAIPQGGLITIGAAQDFKLNQLREENQFYRQFIVDPAHPEASSQPAETYPGLIKYTLELKRVDLHDANLFEAFKILNSAGRTVNIVSQFKPLIIFIDNFVPEITLANSPTGNPGKTLEPSTQILTGCWFNSFPVGYDVTDSNQAYIAETEMIVANVL